MGSPTAVAQALYDAGFRGQALTTMTAISGAESGFDFGSLNNNPSTGDYSVGAFQINYYGNLLGPRTQAYGSPSFLQANPLAQAKAAYSISNGGTNFSPWSTYTSGAYRQYLGTAAAVTGLAGTAAGASALANPGSAGPGGITATLTSASSGSTSIWSKIGQFLFGQGFGQGGSAVGGGSIFSPLRGLGHLLSDLTNPGWWRRLGIGVAGVVLMLLGSHPLWGGAAARAGRAIGTAGAAATAVAA